MPRTASIVTPLLSIGLLSGCSLAGSWKAVEVRPPDEPFPLAVVTFDRHDNYTATCSHDDRTHTTTGRYEWNGLALRLERTDGTWRTYDALLRLDGRLRVTNRTDDRKITALLERQRRLP